MNVFHCWILYAFELTDGRIMMAEAEDKRGETIFMMRLAL